MNIGRYKKWILILSISFSAFTVMILVEGLTIGTVIQFFNITTGNYWIDVFLIFLAISIVSIITFYGGGYLLTPLFLYIHKKILGKKLVYGIQEKPQAKKFRGTYFKALGPALMTIHLGLLISNNIDVQELIFTPSILSYMQTSPTGKILTLMYSFPFMAAISIFLFAAAYFIIDSGIICSTKEKDDVKNGIVPTEVNSVGGYFLDVITGFAGISVIFDFISNIVPYISDLIGGNAFVFLTNTIWIVMPFFIALLLIPVYIVQDATLVKRRKFVYKFAAKLGIQGPLEDPLGIKREGEPSPNQ